MAGGRPVAFESPDDFTEVADAYFADCDAEERAYTVNGLALALGLCRQSLLNYGEKPEFLDAVKRIRTKLEAHWEERLASGNAAGTIFWLKNQGWTDRQVLAGDPEAPLGGWSPEKEARLAELTAKLKASGEGHGSD